MPQFSIIAEVDIEVTASTESEARRAAFSLLSSVKPAKQRVRKSKSSKPGDPNVESYLNGEPTSASITGIGLEISHPKPVCESRTFAGVTGPIDPTTIWGDGALKHPMFPFQPVAVDITETSPTP
jgi:hypothetical protein